VHEAGYFADMGECLFFSISFEMNAAAPGGARSKNSDEFFSNQSSLMRRLSPRGGSIAKWINRLLFETIICPAVLEEPDGSSRFHGSDEPLNPRRGPEAGDARVYIADIFHKSN
jgi:hypothetical protein